MSDDEFELMFPSEAKDRAKQAYVEGWHCRVGEEELDDITRRAGESQFEQWYKARFE